MKSIAIKMTKIIQIKQGEKCNYRTISPLSSTCFMKKRQKKTKKFIKYSLK